MKKVLISFVLMLMFSVSTFASKTPTELVKLIENKIVTVTIEEHQTEFFKLAKYDVEKEMIEFVTGKNIAYIQIFNAESNLEFQLPVMSNKVYLSKNLFNSGAYKLGFMIEGKATIEFTDVVIF